MRPAGIDQVLGSCWGKGISKKEINKGCPSTGKHFLILQGKCSQAGVSPSGYPTFHLKMLNEHNQNSQRADEGQEPKDKEILA